MLNRKQKIKIMFKNIITINGKNQIMFESTIPINNYITFKYIYFKFNP